MKKSMWKKIELGEDDEFDASALKRPAAIDPEAVKAAAEAIESVQSGGDAVLEAAGKEACGAKWKSLEVTEAEIAAAQAEVDEDFLDELAYAIENASYFHERQRQESWFTSEGDGRFMGQQVMPLQRVGFYAGGGRESSCAAVLTCAVPALVADVEEMVLCTPPREDGTVDPYTLVAATNIGIERIFKVGGAQAIAAMAYGTETIPKVDKIAGCGDARVAAAKKLVYGDVGIDMPCGPAETCILADYDAVPAFVAVDLLFHAERSPEAASYLVVLDGEMLPEIESCMEKFLDEASDADALRAALANLTVVVCAAFSQAFDVVNEIAPAYLELFVTSPVDLIGAVRNAGSVFMGGWTPASAGPYAAGFGCSELAPGAALYTGALSADDFVKKIPFVSYTFDSLGSDAFIVSTLSQREGMWTGNETVALRLDFIRHMRERVLGMMDDEPGDGCCGGGGHGHADGGCCGGRHGRGHDGECECREDGAGGPDGARGKGKGECCGGNRPKKGRR